MAGKCPKKWRAQFSQDAQTMTVRQLAEKYDRAWSTIKDWRVELYHAGELLWYPGIQVGDVEDYDDYIEIQDNAIITGDLEVPHHNPQLLGYMVEIAKLFGIGTLIIAGDFVANDAVGYHAHRREDTDRSTRYTLRDALHDGELVLQSLFEWFQSIYLIKGNHEQRATQAKELGFFNMMRDAWQDLGHLEISYYKWMLCQGRRIEHPSNYSKVPGSVVRERAEIENQGVMGGHTHHFSRSYTRDGRHEAIDLGHCTLPKTRYYKTVNGTTRHPKWVSGFWVLQDGYAYPFPLQFTDWEFWLRRVRIETA